MGYDHSLSMSAKVKPGTPVETVAQAFKPYFDYAGYDGVDAFTEAKTVVGDDKFTYDTDTGEIEAYTCGEVGYGFSDIITDVAGKLGEIVSEPGEIRLINHDTGDIDEAVSTIFFGANEEEIGRYRAQRDINAAIELMKPHLSEDTLRAVLKIIVLTAQ